MGFAGWKIIALRQTASSYNLKGSDRFIRASRHLYFLLACSVQAYLPLKSPRTPCEGGDCLIRNAFSLLKENSAFPEDFKKAELELSLHTKKNLQIMAA